MAPKTLPPADAGGYWHYTYITYHPKTGEWYGGKHTTSLLDDGYLGSGKWIATHPAPHELVIEIIAFFATEAEAYAAETAMITFHVIDNDPLCRNRHEGGVGWTREAVARMIVQREADPEYQQKRRESTARARATPEWRQNMLKAFALRETDLELRQKRLISFAKAKADPEFRQKRLDGIARINADPEYQRKSREALARMNADPEIRRKQNARKEADPVFRQKRLDMIARREANRAAKKLASQLRDGPAVVDEVTR